MHSDNEFVQKFIDACASANAMGWRKFHMEVFNSLERSNPNLYELLHGIISQANLFKRDEYIIRETVALIIKVIWPIPPISAATTSRVSGILQSRDRSHQVDFVADGLRCLQEGVWQPLYLEIDKFLQDVSSGNNTLYHSTRAVVCMLMATIR